MSGYDEEKLKEAAGPLLTWYEENKRELPWRREPTPYHVWVSEIMLQQTRVSAVIPYYERFLAKYPTVAALAGAEDEELMKCWEGLGYYRRARHLKQAAVQIQETYGGELPGDETLLQMLPGIGAYTAGAIASIAYRRPVPAVDGNLLRVCARLTGDERDILKETTKNDLTEALCAAIPQENPGDFNQAMMDLGATVCLPNGAPVCENCPLQDMCVAHREKKEAVLPVRKEKTERRKEDRTVFLLWDHGRVALRKREDRGLLAGLWEYPQTEGTLSEQETADYLGQKGIRILDWKQKIDAVHLFSHVEWHMTGYFLLVTGSEKTDWTWAEESEFRTKTIPSAFARYTAEITRWWEEDT